jgi:hypothetical protein
MKKALHTLTLLAILGLSAKSQTITYANFSNELAATTNLLIANTSSFNMALTTTLGSGVTWNAAGLTQQASTPVVHLSYYAAAGIPHYSFFNSSNYVPRDPALLALISDEFDYYCADSVALIGKWAQNGSHEIYQNPDVFLFFPMAYGATKVDTYSKTNYSDSLTVSSHQTGKHTIAFNGFGTLILPQGSFSNVALVSDVRTNSLGPDSPTSTWYDISTGKMLLQYHENAGSTSIGYTSDLVTEILEADNDHSFSLFPNPTSNFLTITKLSGSKTGIEVFDVLGAMIYSSETTNTHTTIDLSNVPKGLYFLKIACPGQKATSKKILVQ